MPNDAKLGLVVGVALVIAVAVVFFRKEPSTRLAVGGDPAGVEQATKVEPRKPPTNEMPAAPPADRQHVIQSGDTLYSLAERYYGDGEDFYRIWKANRQLLRNPDQLPAGLTLRIP